MEVWIDPEKMSAHSQGARQLLAKIRAGEQIEVSTGLFTGAESSNGTYGDREYYSIWRGIIPDHLALLPDGTLGACSIADGCGVYANAAAVAAATRPSELSTYRLAVNHAACNCADHNQCTCGSLSSGGRQMAKATTKPSKDAKKAPYGNVDYADPGYQKDKKKRYPVDTAEHIR